jgi:hypothetical protein
MPLQSFAATIHPPFLQSVSAYNTWYESGKSSKQTMSSSSIRKEDIIIICKAQRICLRTSYAVEFNSIR